MARRFIPRTKMNVCMEPRCQAVTGSAYCDEHKPKKKASPRTERDRFLDTRAWRKMSKAKLNETPYCELCHEKGVFMPAKDVDHILPRGDYPHLALEYSNLQSLCAKHHGRKTGKGL